VGPYSDPPHPTETSEKFFLTPKPGRGLKGKKGASNDVDRERQAGGAVLGEGRVIP
jgi:hypothetical protein